MAQFSRHVTVDWQGTLMEGKGQAKAGSGAFTLPVTFPQRIGEAGGTTSPEELIAGAHAACYAMVIAGAMAKNHVTATRHHVTCTVTADKTDAGIKITTKTPDKQFSRPEADMFFETFGGVLATHSGTQQAASGTHGGDVRTAADSSAPDHANTSKGKKKGRPFQSPNEPE